MTRLTRPPLKQLGIADHLRGRILAGDLGPGDRFPTRVEIQQQFAASTHTVQSALDRLLADGFITPAGRRGTFVADHPPHLHRYVLAFPYAPGTSHWVRFWTVLADAAHELGRGPDLRVEVLHGTDPGSGGDGLRRLEADVRARRLAGIVFATDPQAIEASPVVAAPGLARVTFRSPRPGALVPGVDLGATGALFFDRALAHLADRGRRRIGLITVPGISGRRLDAFRDGLARHGMTCHPWWVQAAHQSDPRWAENLATLMLRGKPADRPDALILADDNLVEHACAGIAASGLRVPADLDVVAHCNFPAPAPRVLAITRLGYDVPAALRTCLDLLARQRAGRKVPAVTTLPPVFEHETTSSEPSPGTPGEGRARVFAP